MCTKAERLDRPVRDIEQALRASRLRFRNIIERNADGILVVDREGRVLFANQAAVRLLDRGAEELMGSKVGFPIARGETTEIE
jgi:PAS domain S-box-containing protein